MIYNIPGARSRPVDVSFKCHEVTFVMKDWLIDYNSWYGTQIHTTDTVFHTSCISHHSQWPCFRVIEELSAELCGAPQTVTWHPSTVLQCYPVSVVTVWEGTRTGSVVPSAQGGSHCGVCKKCSIWHCMGCGELYNCITVCVCAYISLTTNYLHCLYLLLHFCIVCE